MDAAFLNLTSPPLPIHHSNQSEIPYPQFWISYLNLPPQVKDITRFRPIGNGYNGIVTK